MVTGSLLGAKRMKHYTLIGHHSQGNSGERERTVSPQRSSKPLPSLNPLKMKPSSSKAFACRVEQHLALGGPQPHPTPTVLQTHKTNALNSASNAKPCDIQKIPHPTPTVSNQIHNALKLSHDKPCGVQMIPHLASRPKPNAPQSVMHAHLLPAQAVPLSPLFSVRFLRFLPRLLTLPPPSFRLLPRGRRRSRRRRRRWLGGALRPAPREARGGESAAAVGALPAPRRGAGAPTRRRPLQLRVVLIVLRRQG